MKTIRAVPKPIAALIIVSLMGAAVYAINAAVSARIHTLPDGGSGDDVTYFTITVTVYDSLAAMAVNSHTATVVSAPALPPQSPGQPLLFGWGGILATGSGHFATGNPASVVFPGEQASNTEVAFSIMKIRGYNGAKISLVDPVIGGDASSYDSNAWHRTLQIARFFNFAVIGDDHEYEITDEGAWLDFWQTIIQDTPQSEFPNVIWEPRNEPEQPSTEDLGTKFQAFITIDRALGDTRWIVLGGNNFASPNGGANWLDEFPVVTDPVDHIFYDFHEYYFYQYHSDAWDTSSAEEFADFIANGITDLQNAYGRPVLMTEFGADFGPCIPGCPPDVQATGSAGYSDASLAYAQRLAVDLNNMGVGYMVWTAGDWTDTPNAGATGALNIWGQLVEFPSPPAPPPLSPGGSSRVYAI